MHENNQTTKPISFSMCNQPPANRFMMTICPCINIIIHRIKQLFMYTYVCAYKLILMSQVRIMHMHSLQQYLTKCHKFGSGTEYGR